MGQSNCPPPTPKNLNQDQQPILTRICLQIAGPKQEAKHLYVTLGKLDHKVFSQSLQEKLNDYTLCPLDRNISNINKSTENLTEVTLHWRIFLADKGTEHAFQAYRFTKERSTNEISALKDPDGNLATEMTKKANILFEGMTLISTDADLHDIPPLPPPSSLLLFPPITKDEIDQEINKLANKKAAGPDKIPNELLKIANKAMTPHLSPLFNACLRKHHFLKQWKQAITVIIKKAAKEDYTNPNAYQPIALLNTLGKLLEKIINN
ncbi:hypothetical protein O181_040688 [Austropuccinia psidii MF-1]|uniref:Reverse transcriptase domain-containing protein n=1 Tax=Austropuccinia psidii MF-1 TaxID=1389203 RepID=A0A9Q3DFV7_9BASI|nr:hypothetical protein [Austropuccinia psidii MF-1]